jgi:hypothetical protein
VNAQEKMVVNLKFRYEDGRPIPNKNFRISNSDKSIVFKEITSDKGDFTIVLQKGFEGAIEFAEAGFNWSFELIVPKDFELNVYEKVCKISIKTFD